MHVASRELRLAQSRDRDGALGIPPWRAPVDGSGGSRSSVALLLCNARGHNRGSVAVGCIFGWRRDLDEEMKDDEGRNRD